MTSTVIDRITGLGASVAVKAPCRLVSAINLPTLAGLLTVDGSVAAADDRILVNGQTDAKQNGIYIASATDWKRAPDGDGTDDFVRGTRIYVWDGPATSEYICTTSGVITPGTTALHFSGAGVGVVSSVFGRGGAVNAVGGDYNAGQITNTSSVVGATVAAALNTLLATAAGLQTADSDLTAIAALTGAGIPARSVVGTWALRSLAVGTGLAVANATGEGGDPTVSLGTELAGLAGLATAGLISRTGAGSYIPRSITGATNGAIGVTNGDGAAGNPALSVDIGSLTADNSPAADDVVVVLDVSGSVLRKTRVDAIATVPGAGAPTGASYVTLGTDATLTSERVLTAGTAIGLTDAGAGSTLTVAVNDAELLALAGLTSAADKVPYFTGSGTAAVTDLTSTSRTLLGNGTLANWRSGLGLAIGADVQAYDADLAAIAALATTGYGRALLTLADAAALTAALNNVVGDSGSGGTKGLVPAAAAGDAAAGKFLKADGTFTAPPQGLTKFSDQQPTSDVATINVTGLSAYSYVYCMGVINMATQGADLIIRMRTAGGTYRSLGTLTTTGGLVTIIGFQLTIGDCNVANEKVIVIQYTEGASSTLLDSSDAMNGPIPNTGGQAARMFYASWDETWDEVEISLTVGNISGATADLRGRVIAWGG